MNRRDFLKYSLLIPSIPSYVKNAWGNSLSQAALLANAFPAEIPYSSSVKKYIIPDSNKCLVHIKQAHRLSSTQIDYIVSKEFQQLDPLFKKVCACQRDIYEIIKFLSDNGLTKEIMAEGYSVETQKQIAALKTRLQTTVEVNEVKVLSQDVFDSLNKLSQIGYFSVEKANAYTQLIKTAYVLRHETKDMSDTEIKQKQQRFQDLRNNYGEAFDADKYYFGGAMMLALDDRINLLPAETKMFQQPELIEFREHFVLSAASESDKYIVYVLFGGEHNFGGKESCGIDYQETKLYANQDNLHLWNKDYPYEKFSLIEITPKNYFTFRDVKNES